MASPFLFLELQVGLDPVQVAAVVHQNGDQVRLFGLIKHHLFQAGQRSNPVGGVSQSLQQVCCGSPAVLGIFLRHSGRRRHQSIFGQGFGCMCGRRGRSNGHCRLQSWWCNRGRRSLYLLLHFACSLTLTCRCGHTWPARLDPPPHSTQLCVIWSFGQWHLLSHVRLLGCRLGCCCRQSLHMLGWLKRFVRLHLLGHATWHFLGRPLLSSLTCWAGTCWAVPVGCKGTCWACTAG